MSNEVESCEKSTKCREWGTFLLITVVVIPILTVGLIGAYGFVVWMLQLIYGPPGHGM
ncbi:hypothetical protein VST7929_00045 [Vibrio stylophorae]|uniref:Trimethylamine N-oxide reductase system protein TorE n=1 Tax=Vibrio stylophorae TaxID=659351 RepID=A0ABN8DQ15_9VIBR|nr:hypothetical protein VST7929_00045 [Vibrio stylophorae]